MTVAALLAVPPTSIAPAATTSEQISVKFMAASSHGGGASVLPRSGSHDARSGAAVNACSTRRVPVVFRSPAAEYESDLMLVVVDGFMGGGAFNVVASATASASAMAALSLALLRMRGTMRKEKSNMIDT